MAGPAASGKKRPFNEGRRHFKKNKKQKKESTSTVKEGSNEEVLIADVRALLEKHSLLPSSSSTEDASPPPPPETPSTATLPLPEPFTELDVEIDRLSSTGDGLALIPGTTQIAVVPFTAPGDTVRVKVIKHMEESGYTLTDYLHVVKPSPHRDDSLVKCQYFSKCSGCQFQHLPYAYQLDHKKSIVQRAYKNFCDLPASSIPEIGDTIGSPLQYGYRTKLTPHFDGPANGRRDRRHGTKPTWDKIPEIGFMLKGTRKTMDIEDCPIGTQAVRLGMKSERARVHRDIDTYQRGATLLLRESTQRLPKKETEQGTEAGKETEQGTEAGKESTKEDEDVEGVAVYEDMGAWIHKKTCVTNQTAVSTEYIADYRFDNPAGSFFQNNNSILPTFTDYIRDNILPKDKERLAAGAPQITNLIDAYSGSGLFTVTLSPLFKNSIGIDVSTSSIQFATKNAQLNSIPPDRARFWAGDANNIFAEITFPAAETAVVIDPSRKGCDENFLGQLLRFGPERVCYVSCNVHTQARDVGVLVGGLKDESGKVTIEGLYEIESLRGFDFFPQTGHVEGVCFLRKKKGHVAAAGDGETNGHAAAGGDTHAGLTNGNANGDGNVNGTTEINGQETAMQVDSEVNGNTHTPAANGHAEEQTPLETVKDDEPAK